MTRAELLALYAAAGVVAELLDVGVPLAGGMLRQGARRTWRRDLRRGRAELSRKLARIDLVGGSAQVTITVAKVARHA